MKRPKKGGIPPPVLSKRLAAAKMPGYLAASRLFRWYDADLDPANKWIVVAQKANFEEPHSEGTLFTWSVLVALRNGDALERLIGSHEWKVHQEFGKPWLEQVERSPPVFHRGDKEETDDAVFEAFVYSRHWPARYDRCFEVLQEYLLYHNARQDGNEWNRVGPSGEKICVLRETSEAGREVWEAPRTELCDYLAARGCHLLRQHDHDERFKEGAADLPAKGWRKPFRSKRSVFDVLFRLRGEWGGDRPLLQFLGVDFVEPSATPADWHLGVSSGDGDGECLSFIIGTDEDGKPVESTCDPEKISNYFVEREGEGHYLSGVYFERRALKRYYDEPDRYEVWEPGGISCGGLWSLPFDVLKDGTLHVHLKDLSRIPVDEQAHWRKHNIIHRQEITDHRFRTDFEAEWDDYPRVPQHVIRNAQSRLTGEVGGIDLPILKKLRIEDQYIPRQIHVPFDDSWAEFDQQVGGLEKMVADALDVEALKKRSGKLKPARDPAFPMDWLESALANKGLAKDEIARIMEPLRTLRDVRSMSDGHRKNSEFPARFAKAAGGVKDKRLLFARMLQEVSTSLEELVRIFSKTPPKRL